MIWRGGSAALPTTRQWPWLCAILPRFLQRQIAAWRHASWSWTGTPGRRCSGHRRSTGGMGLSQQHTCLRSRRWRRHLLWGPAIGSWPTTHPSAAHGWTLHSSSWTASSHRQRPAGGSPCWSVNRAASSTKLYGCQQQRWDHLRCLSM